MLDRSDLYPPIAYQLRWLVIGAVLLLLIGLWLIGLQILKRRAHRPVRAAPKPISKLALTKLRTKYRRLIDELETELVNGRLKPRAMHQKLSVLLRLFAYEASGIPAHVLTLRDLQATKLSALSATIATYYMPEFSTNEAGDGTAALTRAREVVDTWPS